MCDCYDHKCEVCENTIPMHIADFDFPREDFKVYCQDHISEAPNGAIIFELLKNTSLVSSYVKLSIGWKCAIAGPEMDKGGNHPNVGVDWKEEIKTKKI